MSLSMFAGCPSLELAARRARHAFPSRHHALAILIAAAFAPLGAGTAHAAGFTIDAPATAAQTLGSGSGQTGIVTATGSLTVSGSAVAVTVSGNNATLTNLGTISQTGNGRVVRDNTGVTGLVITNGSTSNAAALMQAADADVIQMNKSPASVTLNNYGSMISLNASAGGSQVVDFNAIASGANTVNNFAGATMRSYEADVVRPGVNGTVFNAGVLLSTTSSGSSSDGIDVQSNTGVRVNNIGTGLIEGARHGITGGPLDAVTTFSTGVTNDVGSVIRGDNGSGINLDGFNGLQTATIVNNGLIFGNGVTGDGDGVDVDGLVNITNTGVIRSLNAFSLPANGPAFSEGITVGGGTIVNSGTIEGLVAAGNTNAVGRGITLAGNDIASGPLAGTREGLYGNAVITNQAGGLIRGQTDSAIAVDGARSGFTVTINNDAAATIVGGGTAHAAIRTGLDNDAVNNAGRIDGSSSGQAIDLGGGNNTLNIIGGHASVLGNIDGGVGGSNVMTIAAGDGNAFSYAGSIAHFGSVEVKSGTVDFSGNSTYAGTTLLSGGTLILDGANRLASASALAMNGGTLRLLNAGGANGQTFASLALTDSSTIGLGLSSLTFLGLGPVLAGKTLTIIDYLAGSSPDYAFRFLGDYSANADFLTLIGATTIDQVSAAYRFDGTYTDVTGAVIAPVPEPETYAMLLAGFALLGAATRRQRRKHPRGVA